MTRRRTPSRGGGIGTVAVVGTGVIGASWAAHFLAHGMDVTATDPAPGAEERLRADVAAHWPVLEPVAGASPDRLTFTADPAASKLGLNIPTFEISDVIRFAILYERADTHLKKADQPT